MQKGMPYGSSLDSEAMRYFEDVMKQRLQRHLGLRVIELAAILEIEDSDREKAW
jgi:hypothetical protein